MGKNDQKTLWKSAFVLVAGLASLLTGLRGRWLVNYLVRACWLMAVFGF